MMGRGLMAGIGVLGTALLGGCEALPPPPVFPDITFAHLAPFRVDVAAVEVVEAYAAPRADPHVEHLAPVPPATAMRRWVADRILPVGETGTIRITIQDARITGAALDVNETFSALFTTEQAARYDGHAAMLIEVLDERRIARALAEGQARRDRTTPEGINLRQRDEMLFALTEALLADLDAALEPNIERYLGAYLR